jgi:hypothetical protein
MKKLIALFILAALAEGCTTIRIPTMYGDATVTAPVFLTTQDFSLTRTSDTLAIRYQRGTDPQTSTIVGAVVTAAVAAAAKGAK